MPRLPEPELQQIGWNGTRMEIPAGWQPVVILGDYLLFEDRYQPILEMKWQHLDGSLSTERIIRQLRRGAGKKDTIEAWTPPDDWQSALSGFDVLGFSWSNAANTGRGLLLHCTTCDRATLLQFYGPRPERNKACLHLLASLEDHAEGREQPWSIYDINFTLPATARLRSQKFLTGSYTVSLQIKDLFFSLLRFKPAKVLLADGDLQDFGTRLLKHGEQLVAEQTSAEEAVWQKQANKWQRLRAKLRRQQAEHYLRLHHDPRFNIILGIQARSNLPIDENMINTIFTNYNARLPHG